MPPHTYRAVLFDLDNTLADRDTAIGSIARALHAWRPEIAADVSVDDFIPLFTEMDDGGKAGRGLLLKRTLAKWPAIGLDLPAMLEWFGGVYGASFPHDPSVIEFLNTLNNAKIPWGIVTNGSERQHETTQALGIEAICPCIITSGEVGFRKPGPTIFTSALECLGLEVSLDVIFVGDDPVADIEGAQTLGLSTAWMRLQRPWTDPYFEPDHQIDRITDLAPLLGL
jgi:putative hydrolase of the HAD superfamily